ncbi:ABC transporter ATP-binding protein [Anaerobacillus alkaliphilus]|uniref:ABC transporter ATP-binding protein n=1 Tax=Anaerobacillus alkaliphilus TaxID=1548597 RepID=A0A4Q0VN91_9BACI|nr:ABC transporter ATP-binding protein [Anaerobacillus alkaliphilus]RXI96282.1 ABC transporter ATP-binding protein [Anaerobacillus alkaliphilus]
MSLIVDGLTKSYSKHVQALKHVSFSVSERESIGIVGESGSGKSTLAKILLGLETYKEGSITFNGEPIAPKKRALLRQYRKNVQMIFQDSTSTLNPKLPIWRSVLEPLDNYKEVTPSFIEVEGKSRKEVAVQLLEMVGLTSEMADRYPWELSGGQKQRVSIARALSIEPSLLVCDEPTASLDVTVQMLILNLLKDFKETFNMSIIFISHDIRAVAFLCEKIIVLKDGSIVDEFRIEDIYDNDRHPYTKALIRAASIE